MNVTDLKETGEYKLYWQDLRSDVDAKMMSEHEAEMMLVENYVTDKMFQALNQIVTDLKERGVTETEYQELTTSIFEQLEDASSLFPSW